MPKLSRKQVYELIDGERDYQDIKWPQQDKPSSSSDALRVVKVLLRLADSEWYTTQDFLVDGVKVNPADLAAARKIAGVCVRLMENFGAPKREMPKKVIQVKPRKS
ncbi:MAG: hypothetical protein WC797_01160 [Candidatus Paceibacterota bacterium]|jgi:hypothetical protein